jgi:DNA-binding MarR family transcriptional regulator
MWSAGLKRKSLKRDAYMKKFKKIKPAAAAKIEAKVSVVTPSVEPGSELSELAAFLIAVNKIGDALQFAAEVRQSGVTITDWLLLKTLEREGPMSMAKAAAYIGVSRQRVHQQSAPLESMEAISVAPSDDGKSRIMTLASGGQSLVDQLDETFSSWLTGDDGVMLATPIHTARISTGRIQKLLVAKRWAASAA